MTWNNSSFTEHYRKIKIEGFQLDRLIDRCIKKQIQLRSVTFVSDLEITLLVSCRDYNKLKKLAKNTYKITVLKDGGYKHVLRKIRRRKITVLGVLLFIAFFYYQSLFVVEIRIDGYEKLAESQLRQTLAEIGLYEGCRKNVDVGKVKIKLYETYDEISWVGIDFTGNLATVRIAEGAKPVKPRVEKKKPCNIVADKAGYIHKIIPVEGLRAVKDKAYVEKGDVIITGEVPLRNVAYGTDTENDTKTYVHAEGTVEAKIPVHIDLFSQRYERVKTETGKKIRRLCINDHNFAKAANPFAISTVKTKNLINLVKPFHLKIDLVTVEKVNISEKEIKNKDLEKVANAKIRQFIKENLPEKTQILNKSLNFSREKNIITIGVTLETLQQIGTEKEIVVDKSDGKLKKDNDQ